MAVISGCAQWLWPPKKGSAGSEKGSSTPKPPSSMVAPRASAAQEAKPLSFWVRPLLLFLMAADVAPARVEVAGGRPGAVRAEMVGGWPGW